MATLWTTRGLGEAIAIAPQVGLQAVPGIEKPGLVGYLLQRLREPELAATPARAALRPVASVMAFASVSTLPATTR